ncbi:MAG: hypothetical protein A3D44_02265 [Candidatus Staskawiczbacteria bacterium RIFCSPHIGHO2_02_FULL_42_22]|uniref:Uncharacterized protein n=1 Tax=Candidatus Staskawiczbacteria bacterium RIFCSPHIGHO2_02_FULL_42_22 TaxID=1802207 RepID=A0A1G2I416_9BACT|nr:MAG: hypothetical protein A3D44_02265 [Candidatus Staskawiczbacteria bacterium RIFCSPHIGHO2_02_FULL_42_22]
MMFNDSPKNQYRLEGRVFSGFAHPATGKIHRLRILTGDQRSTVLSRLAMDYISLFGLFATGAMKFPKPGEPVPPLDEIGLDLNPPDELRAKLQAAANYLPDSQLRVDYGIKLSQVAKDNQPVPRVILLSEGDQKNVPPEFYDTFCYWFLSTASPKELANRMETRFDAILNLVAWEARNAANSGPSTSRQIYEEILDQAIADAEVTLEPLLSHAPSKVHALTLKTVVYMLLARERLAPDGFFNTVNSNVHIAPLDYFTDRENWTWRTDRDGFWQLLAEGLLINTELLWQRRPKDNLDNAQILVDVLQFLEDIVIFLPRSKGVFDRLLSE